MNKADTSCDNYQLKNTLVPNNCFHWSYRTICRLIKQRNRPTLKKHAVMTQTAHMYAWELRFYSSQHALWSTFTITYRALWTG